MSRMISAVVAALMLSSSAQAQRLAAVPPEPQIDLVSTLQDDRPAMTFDELLSKYEKAQSKLERLEYNLEKIGIEDHGDHFNFASYNRGNASYQPEGGMGGGPGGPDMGDMATQSQNPVGSLWMLWFQNDMMLNEGPFGGKRIFNTIAFQPVMPMQLTKEWRVINRPIFMFPVYEVPDPFRFNPGGSFPPPVAPTDPFDTKGGLGDIVFAQFFSNAPEDSKFVYGVGETWMFPAASDRALGTGKTSVGPAAVGMYMGEKFIGGAIVQQWWSIGGADTRERVSLMDIQLPYRFRLNPMTSIGGSPNIRWDQVTGKWTVPVGLGFETMTLAFGKLPLRLGAEVQYFLSHEGRGDSLDPEWNFRFYVVPIIPAPGWAKTPLLGSRCPHHHRRR